MIMNIQFATAMLVASEIAYLSEKSENLFNKIHILLEVKIT